MPIPRFLALLPCVFLAATGASAAEKISVLATFAPMFCFAKNVAGDAAKVEMLLPASTGPHEFALAPGDLQRIARADVIVQNGLGLEAWLDRAVQSGLKPGAVRIVASRGVDLLDTPGGSGEAGEGPNPHLWLDPVRAIKQVENIRDGLMGRDPANAETYLANSNSFSTKLRNLDDEIGRATVGVTNKRMLTFHDTFPYFAARYGFEIVGAIEAFPGKEPTPKELKRLRDVIRSKGVNVLFSEPQYSPKVMESLAQDLKLPVVAIDPMETGEASAGFYETVMRRNLDTLVKAMK